MCGSRWARRSPRRDRSPGRTRLLLWAGLVLCAGSILVDVSGWNAGATALSPAELIAWVRDPDRQQERFLREIGGAAFLGLGIACFAVALTRLPRHSLTGTAGYAAASAGIGVLVLLAQFWWAVDEARHARPDPPPEGAFVQAGVAVAVATGPHLRAAVPLAVVLGGAALLAVSCAWLTAPAREPS